jgi:hypothetical protein
MHSALDDPDGLLRLLQPYFAWLASPAKPAR